MQENEAVCLLSIPSSVERGSNLIYSWPSPMLPYRSWWNCCSRLCCLLPGWLCAQSLGALCYILSQFSSSITHAHKKISGQPFLPMRDKLPHMRPCMWEEYTKEWNDSESLEKQNVAADW